MELSHRLQLSYPRVNIELNSHFRSPCQMDIHLTPFYRRCDYCNIDYDFIGKVETFNEDVKFIFEKSGLNKTLKNQYNKQKHANAPHDNTRISLYFKDVDYDKIMKLYRFYQIDFEMFDYDLEDLQIRLD